jgi:general secretion pathway protein G
MAGIPRFDYSGGGFSMPFPDERSKVNSMSRVNSPTKNQIFPDFCAWSTARVCFVKTAGIFAAFVNDTETRVAEPRLRRRTAFTLIEIMVVVAIIGILAAIAVPGFLRIVYRAQVTRAINDIRVLGAQIDVFELENARTPNDLAEINRANFMDPWGRPYVYLSFAAAGPSWKGKARKDHSLVPLNTSYDLYSVGKDGKTSAPLTAKASDDDVLRADDGGYIGLGSQF